MRRIAVMVALLAGACGLGACGAPGPRAHDGVLDLRGWDARREGALTVGGDWQFNWQELVAPDARPPPDAYLPLRRWNGLKLFDGRALPGKGYATYRLRVLLPAGPAQPFTIVLDPVIDACRLWVTTADGRHAGPIGGGQVGTTRATSHGSLARTQLTFDAAGEVTLTLQVSNFEHARGGSAGASPIFGTAAGVDSYLAHQRMADFFFIGLLVITGLHHLVLFALRRRERAAFWFAAMCLLLALRLYTLGRYLQLEIPSLGPGLPHRLESLTFFLSVPAAALFLNALFPKDIPWRVAAAVAAISAVFAASVVLPVSIYSEGVPAYQLVTLATIVIGVAGVVRAVVRERDVPPVLMLSGLLCIGLAAGLDILRERSIVHIRFIAQYGITGFVIFQSALLALLNQRRAKQLALRNDEVVRLNSELHQLNEELKRQIATRSHELSQAVMMMAAASGPPTLAAGDVVGERYRIVAPIGEGGMGTVFRAERIDDGKAVALKLIRGNAEPEALARFAREAEVVAKIDHPNVVGIYDFNVSRAGMFYLVMELVEGRSLEDERGRFGDVAWALPLAAQLARALAAIHAREVIHRDVKPSNLLLAAGGQLKLADFGVAQFQKQRPPGSTAAETLRGGAGREEMLQDTAELSITRAGVMIGSPMYMAPELAEGSERGSVRSDMFCFGLVAYEMIAGRRAWPRPLVMALMEGLSMPDPAPLPALVPGIDAEVARLIHACLAQAPAERPDAAALVAAFDAAVVSRASPSP